ncbi:MAG: hypothetical protein JEZ11_01785 [Desulfobacterales bacterium]|nr:hypothetical protein [Desulfobacterales bacterium]
MKLDAFLSNYHFSETHEIRIAAPPQAVWNAAMGADLNESVFVKLLMSLRFLPARLTGKKPPEGQGVALTFDDFAAAGFIKLDEEYPKEFLLGLAGRFWKISGELLDLTPAEFLAFEIPGYAKAGWNLTFAEIAPGVTRLSTETRIRCMGAEARRKFFPYWMLIRPFSGLIRMEMLRIIKKQAENAI